MREGGRRKDAPATPAAPAGGIGARVGEDPHFQRRMWRAERIAWIAMALLIAGGLAGAFGDGWLSRQVATSASGGASVSYDAVMRWSVEYELLTRRSDGAGDVDLDPRLLAGLRITATQGGSHPGERVTWVTPRRRFDHVSGAVRLGGGETVHLDILVLP